MWWQHDMIEERVARGVAILDEKLPKWWQFVDPDSIRMCDCHECILGRAYGTYATGIHILLDVPQIEVEAGDDATVQWSRDHGFLASEEIRDFNDPPNRTDEYRQLNVEWKRVIKERQAHDYLYEMKTKESKELIPT